MTINQAAGIDMMPVDDDSMTTDWGWLPCIVRFDGEDEEQKADKRYAAEHRDAMTVGPVIQQL
jgi:hypothetical protein